MSNLLNKKSVTKVNNFFKKINEKIELIILAKTARTAKDAANSLNKEVGAIVKSLLFKNEESNEYYLCLISGDKYLSLDKLSTIIGKKITKADADECKKITGYSIGGVSPVALDTPPTNIFIDQNLNRFNEIFAAAGHPYVVFGIDFKKLCKITKGEVNSIVE